jgi:hypothetical protein
LADGELIAGEPAEIERIGRGIKCDVGVGPPRPSNLRRRDGASPIKSEASRPADEKFIVVGLFVIVNAD